MAKTSVPLPLAGHPVLRAFPQTIDAAVAEIRNRRDRELAVLEKARDAIAAVSPNKPIPEAPLDAIREVMEAFIDGSTGRAGGALDAVTDLRLFAVGYLVADGNGDLVCADDYAAEILEARIAAIDWTREPSNKEERQMRRHVIEHVREESRSAIDEVNKLEELCSGTPARDLAKAIKDAKGRWSAECSASHTEASAKRRRVMAFRLREKIGVANLIGATA